MTSNMTTREQLTHERVTAFLQMITEDGATPAGELPPVEFVEALGQTTELGHGREVAKAARENRAPPDFAPAGGA
jgi:hypothetical protein